MTEPAFLLRDTRTGQEYPILPGGLRIGRTSQNDVVLSDEKVSRNHAALWIQEGELYVRDEDSTNGTWINDERITAPRALQAGDRVRIGDTVFEVAMGAAPSVPIEAPAPAQKAFPTVPFAIGGGVIGLILIALMIRAFGSATPQPTEAPTLTPVPAATATPAPTSTPTAAPTRTPTAAAPQIVVPQLVAPTEGSEHSNPITFQWSGSLRGGQTFQVTAYHFVDGHTVQSGLLTSQEWTRGLPAEKHGEWRWTVSVMEGAQTLATSEEWMFWFNPFPGSGGGPKQPTHTPTPEFRP